MKQYGFIYNDFEKMQTFIYSKNINNNDNILIQVFTGVTQIKFIESIIGEILSILPQAEIIGTTTVGEILRKRALTNSTVISFTVFEETKIKSKLLNSSNNEYELGINIAKELVEEDTKVLILFSDGMLTNSVDILKGIQSVNSNIKVCGGKAGDNGALKETFVFTKAGISKNGVAAVSLTGKRLKVTTDCSFGWSIIGKPMTITKASHNRIYTIDNIKAVDIYKKYLGDELAKELPMVAAEFPLIVIKDDVEIAKVPCACNDDGSLTFLSNVEVNDKVKFGYENLNMLMDKSLEIHNKLAKRNVETLFVYSCFVRENFMQEKTNLEIGILNNIAPTVGFFTYGEFFSFNNSNKVLNMSMTVLGLSEDGHNHQNNKLPLTKSEIKVEKFFKGKDFRAIKAFTNLVEEATKELQQTNRVLEEQKSKIEQMNSITKSILQMNSEMIASGEFDKFIQMLLDKIIDIIAKGKIGSILLVENNRLCYKATRGYVSNKIKNITYDMEEIYRYDGITSDELFNPIIIKEANKPILFNVGKCDYWEEFLDEHPREILACCIGINGEVAGIINIFNTNKDDDFNEEDKSIIKGVCYDIAIALKNFRLLKNVLYMSRYDSLTGVYNRSYFRELLNETANKSGALRKPFIICGIDLNDFKIINDTYGHDKGDEILRKFAEIFKMEMDEGDIFGRIGGDEFEVIFANKNREQVVQIINRICMRLKAYNIKFDGHTSNISFAYGLSEFLSDSDDVNELLKIADNRMYGKKRMMKD